MPFTAMATAKTYTATDLKLPDRKIVYATVVAVDGANLKTSVSAKTKPIDLTAPKTTTLLDGNITWGDIDYQFSTNEINAHVIYADDQSEPIKREWAIGTTPGGTDVMAYKDFADANELSNNTLNLQHRQTYFVTVFLQNNLSIGNHYSTDGVYIDITHPKPGIVKDGGHDIRFDRKYWPARTIVRLVWANFADPDSGLSHYDWAIVDDAEFEVMDWQNNKLETFDTQQGLDMINGEKYFSAVRAWNRAGLYTQVLSDGFVVDVTPPVCGPAIDWLEGVDGDVDYTSVLPFISVRTHCYDEESFIWKVEAAVGTFPGAKDISDFVPGVQGADGYGQVNFTNIETVQAARYYYVTYRAWNNAALKRSQVTDGILLDVTEPKVAEVYLRDLRPLGVSTNDADFQQAQSSLLMTWQFAFIDNESPIKSYNLTVLDEAGKELKSTTVDSYAIDALFTDMNLKNGDIYKLRISATNEAGLTKVTHTDGVMVDNTPPKLGLVRDGQTIGQDSGYWHHTTSMWGNYPICFTTKKGATWPPPNGNAKNGKPCNGSQFHDPESGISYIETSVRDSIGRLVLPWEFTSIDLMSHGRSGKFTQGQNYLFAVRIYNHAGLYTEGISDGGDDRCHGTHPEERL